MLTSFYWILKDKLAGSGMPGVYENEEDGLNCIEENKITHVVSLIEENPDEVFDKIDVKHLHFPIIDMSVPDIRQLKRLLVDIKQYIEEGGAVLVHCKAGMGRTGVVIASYLVSQGYDADEAIKEIRKINPGYIQNSLQERFIRLFAIAL
ncbi:MAG: dual specificity protein phosphatase family protein [Cyclobacteriaceae bacterium]